MALQLRHDNALQVQQPTSEQRYRLALDTIHQQQIVIRQLEDAVHKSVRCEQLKFDECVGTSDDTPSSDAARQVSSFAELVLLRSEIQKIRMQRKVAAERYAAQVKMLEADLHRVRREVAALVPEINLIQFVDSQRPAAAPLRRLAPSVPS